MEQDITVCCMVCSEVIHHGDATTPVSHGIGGCCWDKYRSANGLAPKPYVDISDLARAAARVRAGLRPAQA